MSHIVKIATQVRDPSAVRAACQRLGIDAPCQKTVELFSGAVTGLAVQLPDWRYPIVCNTDTGTVHFDNFNGAWGDQRELDRLLQMYAVEKAKIEGRRQGHGCIEQTLTDGSIKLTIQVGGAA